MTNKDKPHQCEAKMSCKATAQLKAEVADEIMEEDKSLSELLEDKENNENKNTEE
jgi:hypothetical protein